MSYPQRIYVLPARQQRQPMTQRMAPVQSRPAPKRALPTEAIVAELLGDDMGPSGPRKRERLTHLTAEEKMDRRKLKNRVAAQHARDKKKERSAKIEDVMRDLVEENRRLRAENQMLRRNNEELLQKQNQMQYQNDENDSKIYTNVAYEEVVGQVDVMVPEETEGTGTVYHHHYEQPLPTHGFEQEVVDQNGYVPDYRYDSMPAHGSNGEDDEQLERILEHLKSPSGEFDRFVAEYIEEERDCYAPSTSSGFTPSEARETLSPGSLGLSPTSSSDWDDDSLFNANMYDQQQTVLASSATTTTTTDDALLDPGNWNFENFDESTIDLNFFQN